MSSRKSSPKLDLKLGQRLEWKKIERYEDAILGDFEGGDGVRFHLSYHPTCYRRGPWRLLIEIVEGEGHMKWGCFDDQDQPTRNFHKEEHARGEAQAIADVLIKDRLQRE